MGAEMSNRPGWRGDLRNAVQHRARRTRLPLIILVVAATAATLVVAEWDSAIQIPVAAKKLLVLDKPGKGRVVFLARDAGVEKGPGAQPEAVSAVLIIAYGNGQAAGRFEIPDGAFAGAAGWQFNDASRAKFLNKDAPAGATQVKQTTLKQGLLLKLVAKGTGGDPLEVHAAGDPNRDRFHDLLRRQWG